MDIISSLPDPILCHILSFLPILHSSVETSVLARRWRYLWTYVRDLHFGADYYDPFYYYTKPRKSVRFSDMVDRVLLMHNGSIDTLTIESNENTSISEHQIDAWIHTAMAHGVHDFFLSDVWFPQFHCKCKNLVKLTLKRCTISIEPGAVCLPRLKKLCLLSNSYKNDRSLPNLVSGCSAVELLCDFDHKHKLVLDVPAVQDLRIQDDTTQIIRAYNISSLVRANICFLNGYVVADIRRPRYIFQFIEKLSNAKSLKIQVRIRRGF
ncbi:F-box/FBD/LRR-repeat protein At5g56420-like isoform X2 [Henckelia pumila]|uniref:F-box/FBD/LRR-repeat protein At5g56420-like isoform X2 n=1 Tax=Henckelia pumila TaxID=405737 RepID=UPI003C6E8B8C